MSKCKGKGRSAPIPNTTLILYANGEVFNRRTGKWRSTRNSKVWITRKHGYRSIQSLKKELFTYVQTD